MVDEFYLFRYLFRVLPERKVWVVMGLIRSKVGVGVAISGMLLTFLGFAAPAQAAPSRVLQAQEAPVGIQAACNVGPDGTAGAWAYCTGSGYSFRVYVVCHHFSTGIGLTVYGPWKTAGAGQNSYAQCSSGYTRVGYNYEVFV